MMRFLRRTLLLGIVATLVVEPGLAHPIPAVPRAVPCESVMASQALTLHLLTPFFGSAQRWAITRRGARWAGAARRWTAANPLAVFVAFADVFVLVRDIAHLLHGGGARDFSAATVGAALATAATLVLGKFVLLNGSSWPRLNPPKPWLIVVDVNGTLLRPTWKRHFATSYRSLVPGADWQEAMRWVHANTIAVSEREVLQKLAALPRASPEAAAYALMQAKHYWAVDREPRPLPYASEAMRALADRGPIVAVSLARLGRGVAVRQLRRANLLESIAGNRVIGIENIRALFPEGAEFTREEARAEILRALQSRYPGRRILFINDSPDGFRVVREELGGLCFGIVSGWGPERKADEALLRSGNPHGLLYGWGSYPQLLEAMDRESAGRTSATLLNELELTLAGAAHAEEVLTLWYEVFPRIADLYSWAEWRDLISRSERAVAQVLIPTALLNGHVVGAFLAYANPSRTAMSLWNVAVQENYRGLGIGRRLVQFGIEAALQGWPRIRLIQFGVESGAFLPLMRSLYPVDDNPDGDFPYEVRLPLAAASAA
jgi:hypothetical protein